MKRGRKKIRAERGKNEGASSSGHGGNDQAKPQSHRSVMAAPEFATVAMGKVQVYVSRGKDGAPLYIRQYPPTVEELLKSGSDGSSPSFDGFSEASGSTFDGFSDASSSIGSSFDGFSDQGNTQFRLSSSPSNSESEESVEFAGFTSKDLAMSSVKSLPGPLSSKKRERSSELVIPSKTVKEIEPKSYSVSNVEEAREMEASPPKRRRSTLIEDDNSQDEEPARTTRRLSEVKKKNPIDAENFIGDHCSAVNCTVKFLDSMKVIKVNVNFGIVYELNEFAKRIDWNKDYVPKWIQRLSGIKNNKETTAEDLDKINTILRRRKALTVTLAGQKSISAKLKNFDLNRFILPSSLKVKGEIKLAPTLMLNKQEDTSRGKEWSRETNLSNKGMSCVKEKVNHDEETVCNENEEISNKKARQEDSFGKSTKESDESVVTVQGKNCNKGDIRKTNTRGIEKIDKLDESLETTETEIERKQNENTTSKNCKLDEDIGIYDKDNEKKNENDINEVTKMHGNYSKGNSYNSECVAKDPTKEYESNAKESVKNNETEAVVGGTVNEAEANVQRGKKHGRKPKNPVKNYVRAIAITNMAENTAKETTGQSDIMKVEEIDVKVKINVDECKSRKPDEVTVKKTGRKRGRPRKIPVVENYANETSMEMETKNFVNLCESRKPDEVTAKKTGRKRGRPRKIPLVEDDAKEISMEMETKNFVNLEEVDVGESSKQEEVTVKKIGKKRERKSKVRVGDDAKEISMEMETKIFVKLEEVNVCESRKLEEVTVKKTGKRCGRLRKGVGNDTKKFGREDTMPTTCQNTNMETKPRKNQAENSQEPRTKFSSPIKAEEILVSNKTTNDAASDIDRKGFVGPQKTPAGTLGISKSGRLRKASAKGIQSIEIKCLFMEDNFPVTAAAREGCGSDRLINKSTPKNKMTETEKVSVSNIRKKWEGRSSFTQNRTDRSLMSFSLVDNHLVPNFKEEDYNLGPYCTKVGLTVDDLNSNCQIDLVMTNGMIRELHDFYVSRGAPKTALAIRLFKMSNVAIMDYTHLLSCVVRITKVSVIPLSCEIKLQRVFRMPIRDFSLVGPRAVLPKSPKTPPKKPKEDILDNLGGSEPANADGKRIRASRPRKIISYAKLANEEYDDETILDEEIVQTKGKEGCITRGDIYFLYTKWLRDKMAVGGNVFVTDLLKDVEKLMQERKVQAIRVPAGTLMSSSVRLHEEYKEMLLFSKEDALMYLEEDWLEDIQYLVSRSKSRRSTFDGDGTGRTDGDSGGSVSGRVDRDSSPSCAESVGTRSDSELTEKTNEFQDSKQLGFSKTSRATARESSDPVKPNRKATEKQWLPKKSQIIKSGSCMESVGKRMKKISIAKSLEEFDQEMEQELDGNEFSEQEEPSTPVTKISQSVPSNTVIDYEVEKIVNYKEVYYKDKTRRLSYLVRWLGFGDEEDSWVDEDDLECPELLREYWGNKQIPWSTRPRKESTSPSTKLSQKMTPHSNKLLDSPKDIKMESSSTTKAYHDKENMDNIIHAMLQYTSLGDCAYAGQKERKPSVTRRELLSLYDNWRQENQSVLMAGGSNSVNLDVLVERVRHLIESRNITTFHSESLLNACFMMTMMRTRLKSKKALDTFLDGSCSEVLEASHMQHVKRQYCNIDKTAESKYLRKKDSTVSKLKTDFETLKEDFANVRHHRQIDHCKLGALEEELECLQNAFAMSQDKISSKAIVIQNELQKLKADLEALGKRNFGTTRTSIPGQEREASELSLKSVKMNGGSEVTQAMVKLGVPREYVENVQEVVNRRVTRRNP